MSPVGVALCGGEAEDVEEAEMTRLKSQLSGNKALSVCASRRG